MRDLPNLKARVTLHGPEWLAVKEWLEVKHEHTVRRLIKAKTHDETQKLRGAIELIDELLFVEQDAAIAASRQGQ